LGSHCDAEGVERAENVNAMAKSSDGDWNKLTSQQQQQMIQATGSEGTAKMVLQMKAHPPKPIAPGRPTAPGP
jgi:acyl-CoA reductase-like NAD-dependent aldehyde dehydrogenase